MTTLKPEKSDESVLSRWSRRKREAREAREAGDAAADLPDNAPQTGDDTAAQALEEQAPPLTDADMPAIETLTEESDFSVFMSPGVTDELRNLALRKLFHAPVFNIRDGLDEYDDDFTSFEKLGDIVTADMKHQAEIQRQKLRDALAQEEAEQAADTPDDARAAVDENRAGDYTDDSEDDVEADFDDESPQAEAAVAAAPVKQTDTST